MNVLLAEDDENDVLLMQRAFKKIRIQSRLHIVRDGQEVIDYLQGKNCFSDRSIHPLPSLVILDLKMPRRTGFEVLEWMKRQVAFKSIPAVVLTASSQHRDILRAYELYANSYLVKPGAFDELVNMIQETQHYWLKLNRIAQPGA